MNEKESWKEVKLADVMKALDARAPDWVMQLADQQDFRDALRLGGRELLHRRASEKVRMVMRAYAEALLEKEQEPGEEG